MRQYSIKHSTRDVTNPSFIGVTWLQGPPPNFTAHWNEACNTQWMEKAPFITPD